MILLTLTLAKFIAATDFVKTYIFMLTIIIIIVSSYCIFSGTDNDRYVCLTFQNADAPTLIHGLAGYFDTQLYGQITLSQA